MDTDNLLRDNQLFKVEVSPRKNVKVDANEGQDLLPQVGFDFSSGNTFMKPTYTSITDGALLANNL
jgi:hypothetical protein